MEERFGLKKVANPEFKSNDKSKGPGGTPGGKQEKRNLLGFQIAKRSGFSVAERKATITELWNQSDSGKSFRAGLEEAGYVLAYGTRRSYVVVDRAGDIHSVARQTKGALDADIRERFKDLDPASRSAREAGAAATPSRMARTSGRT